MSRRNRSNTASTLTKYELNQLVTTNNREFTHGSIIHLTQLHRWFSVTPISDRPSADEVRRHDFNLLTIYTRLNRLLRKRGLVLKKHNDEYLVLTLETARLKAEEYVRESHRNTYQYNELTEGLRRHQSVWSPLLVHELDRIRD